MSNTLFKKLKDWKIRKVAYLFFALLISLMVTNFSIVYFLGITTEDLLLKDKISQLKTDILELRPTKHATLSDAEKEEKLFRLDVDFLTFIQGGDVKMGERLIHLNALEGKPRDLLFISQKGWEDYKHTLINNTNTSTKERTYASLEIQLNQLEAKIIEDLDKKRSTLLQVIGFTVIGNLLVFGLIYFIMRYLILGPIFQISLITRKLAKGDLGERIQLSTKNEIGYIALNINSLVQILKSATRFSEEIGKGNLEAEYVAQKGENLEENNLATSLINMRNQMAQSTLEENQRNWVTRGLAEFSDTLRSNNDNLELLASNLITNLVKYLDANQGAIFVKSEDYQGELELVAAYAYDRKKKIQKRVLVGEGLVGQAYREKDTLYITEIPDEYMQIRSGLGTSNPSVILLVPLISNEDIQGVIEIASFHDIPEYQIAFVEKLGETIAATISTTRINETTKKLLEESRQMTEEMRAQEEEMRQNMEEMQATQEEMRRTQQELSAKEANLNALINNTEDSIITMSKDYKVMIVNEVQRRRYKGTQYEGIKEGSNALEMLGSVRDEWKGYYDRALAGERLDFVIKSSVKGEDSYRQYFINPIRDQYTSVVGLSVFSRDVTRQKLAEIQNRELMEDISQKNKLFDSSTFFIELNPNKEIIKINELAIKAVGYKESELIGYSLNKILKTDSSLKAGLSVMMKGEIWHEDLELKTKSGTLIPVHSTSTCMLNNEQEVVKFALVFNPVE